ncbi:hypothetical protein [Bernardetia sp.]|uniref:hypothetical protein n=1 Tax=Bernardetia sp. TaxID=1937974 RepID=UPI0025C23FD3|nr:hypothetical protein [Bernardetia sp.]
MQKLFSILILFFICSACFSQSKVSDSLSYLGQKPPSEMPEIFAPNLISKLDRYEFGCTFSRDGKAMFFGVDNNGTMEIYSTHLENGSWTAQEKLFGNDTISYNDPMLSPDDKKLFFISNKPISTSEAKKDIDIWFVERTKKGWSEPKNIGMPINSSRNEYFVSFTNEGTIYFASKDSTENAPQYAYDIYSSELKNGQYTTPKKLPSTINTNRYEADVFVAPDESYLIFCAIHRDGLGRGDLYISFKNESGKWSEAVNMGDTINSENHELCPFVSKDGKYFFYTSNEDIYWVDANILEKYKKK